jgi:glutamine cyclotransferase
MAGKVGPMFRRNGRAPTTRQVRLAALLVAVPLAAAACGGGPDPFLIDAGEATPANDATGTVGDVVDDLATSSDDSRPRTETVADIEDEPEIDLDGPADRLKPEVLERFGHDRDSFTQGLLFHEGRLFESRGLYGESALTEIDPLTGNVLRRTNLSDDYFAEGLALVDDRLIQLTWRAGRAFVYDMETFDVTEEFAYAGEGWGLCFDGDTLWMSDGTAKLTNRDADTFEVLTQVDVTLDGSPLDQLNELECIDGMVWANIWLTDLIVEIHPGSGTVVSLIDASGLLTDDERNAGADVLNGIAYDPERDSMLITGKNWPAMFEVEFVECVGVC